MDRSRRYGLTIVSVVLMITSTAMAQADSETVQRLERRLRQLDETYRVAVSEDQAISERLFVDYGGSIRFGLLGLDDQFGSTRTLRQSDGLLYLRAELDGTHRFYGRLRFLYNDYNSGDDPDGRGDDLGEPIGDRYWYEFDLRGARRAPDERAGILDLRARIGRQFINWGSGLTLSNAMHAGLVNAEWNNIRLTGLASTTPASSFIDFDGSRPGFDSDTNRDFYGGAITFTGLANHQPYVSYLVQRDQNDRNFADFQVLVFNYPTTFKYDSEYLAVGSRGTLGPQIVYRTEVIHQTGDSLSTSVDRFGLPVAQTEEDIDAWAALFSLTYLARDEHNTRFEAEFVGGTGDDDRLNSSNTFGGNQSGTDDHSFNAFGYVNTGLALAPEPANLLSLRLGVSTSPGWFGGDNGWLRVGVSGFLFAKTDSRAPTNVLTNDETLIGGEFDFLIDWRLASDLDLSFRYGVFIPGAAMPAGQDDVRHFAYLGITYAF